MERRTIRSWVAVGVLFLALTYAISGPDPTSTPGAGPSDGGGRIARLFEEQRSGEMVEGVGVVDRLLRDDQEGSRHQRFVLRFSSGQTLLVSHNIDLAPRIVDLREGDRVIFRGQYEWNDLGGVLHWTHHDPDLRRQGGWLEHRGATYR